MFKILSFFILFGIVIFAKEQVEIYAGSMESENNIVKAHGEVTVIYKDYFLTSKEAIYNRDSGELELFDNVRANYKNSYKILGNYAKLNIINKDKSFKPLFLLDKKSQVWITSTSAKSKSNELYIKAGSLSGCDPNNPLWTMDFSSSIYNTQTKWIDIYNARLYIYDIPIIYTPYFGYSLDKTRRTGLLLPALGFSDDEGFYYEQPIYIAEQNWWDLELSPQIRTNRGSGIYAKYRFVDSAISSGELSTGYFKEKDEYYAINDLVNSSHYGFNFKYKNTDFINQWFDLKLKAQSGLYVDITDMNDVDYINLSTNNSIEAVTSSQVLSRINMFYNDDKNYYGAYFKYYKDLKLENNDNTLQMLPTFHYHRYLDTFLSEHIFYNLDIKSNNIYRKINKRAVQTDINFPVTIHTSLFDEYLNISYTSYIYSQYSNFSSHEEIPSLDEYKNGIYLNQYNILSTSTQLTRSYSNFTHTIDFQVDYTFSGTETKSGFYDYNDEYCSDILNQDDSRCEFYNILNLQENVKVSFSQYLFDDKGKERLYHKLSQLILTKESGDKKYDDLENEFEFNLNDSISIYNNSFYNYDNKKFSKIYNKLSVNTKDIDIYISHLYKDTFIDEKDSYLTFYSKYKYNTHYSYTLRYDYDLELDLRKNAEIGFLFKKRCWEFGLKYVENNRPILTHSLYSDSIKDRYIYFTVVFKPFMESSSKPIFIHKLPQSD
ncbi:MAG: LPS-assembly protein LptD [Campylobacterales bacterium]